MLSTLAIAGYRSLRDVVVPLGQLTVVQGGNGVGKTNLYQGFRLLSEITEGRLIPALAAQGGLESALWAGPEEISGAMRRGEVTVQGTSSRRKPVSLQWGFSGDDASYLLDIGLPQAGSSTVFAKDPHIKRELVFTGPVLRPATTLVKRVRGHVNFDADTVESRPIGDRESVLDEFGGHEQAPELATLRRELRGWRFYSSFRTDPASLARQPAVCTRTPVLSDDGHDLAPALATIAESAWASELDDAVSSAFEGAHLHFDGERHLEVFMQQPGILRPLAASEWSDGTLRFLLWCAALLSPQPASLLVLNEPETSLHPRLLAPLARMITDVARRTQVIVVTHASELAALLDAAQPQHIELVKELGETRVQDQGLLTRPLWEWGKR